MEETPMPPGKIEVLEPRAKRAARVVLTLDEKGTLTVEITSPNLIMTLGIFEIGKLEAVKMAKQQAMNQAMIQIPKPNGLG